LPTPVQSRKPPKRLPPADVAWLWNRCAKVLDDTPVCRWLAARAITPIPVEDLDLGRALLLDRPALPRWARFRGRSWRKTGHRLVLPLFDVDGALRSLQARTVEPDPKPGEKAANPTGAQVAGLVFADGLARQLLRGDQTDPTDVVVVEGVPDYLTWATRWGMDGALEDAPAVFGVVAGSWRGAQGQALGRRIPRGSRVVIRTHHDPAGDRYAEEIRKTLRHCKVRRGGRA
jgi:hypothetical protein